MTTPTLNVERLARALSRADDLYATPHMRGEVNAHLRRTPPNPQGQRLARRIAAEYARLEPDA